MQDEGKIIDLLTQIRDQQSESLAQQKRAMDESRRMYEESVVRQKENMKKYWFRVGLAMILLIIGISLLYYR